MNSRISDLGVHEYTVGSFPARRKIKDTGQLDPFFSVRRRSRLSAQRISKNIVVLYDSTIYRRISNIHACLWYSVVGLAVDSCTTIATSLNERYHTPTSPMCGMNTSYKQIELNAGWQANLFLGNGVLVVHVRYVKRTCISSGMQYIRYTEYIVHIIPFAFIHGLRDQ